MAFPKAHTKGTNYELTPQIEAHLESKLELLEKFVPEGASVICDVELEKVAPQQSGKVYRAEINLRVDGKLYRAEATEEKMEDAIDAAKADVKAEISKAASKQQSLIRRGGQRIKDMLRFGR